MIFQSLIQTSQLGKSHMICNIRFKLANEMSESIRHVILNGSCYHVISSCKMHINKRMSTL